MRRLCVAVVLVALSACDWDAALRAGCEANPAACGDAGQATGGGGGTGGATGGGTGGATGGGTGGATGGGATGGGTGGAGGDDAGTPDAGPSDAGAPDAGVPDAGGGGPWNILLADMSNHRLVALDSLDAGLWLSLPSRSQALSKPTKLAFDSQNRLYIADTGNLRILRLDGWDGGAQVAFGNYGVVGSGDPAPPPGMFQTLVSLWVNQGDNDTVYALDSSGTAGSYRNVVSSFRAPGNALVNWRAFMPVGYARVSEITSSPAGDTGFYLCGSGDTGFTGIALMRHYKAIPFDAGVSYPAMGSDRGTEWNQQGALAFGCAIDNAAGYDTGYLSWGPTQTGSWGVSAGSPASSLSDVNNKTAVTGGKNYGTLPALSPALNSFTGIALDATPAESGGYMYLADRYGNRIVKSLKNLTLADTSVFGTFGADAGQFATPSDVRLGPDGRLYVADTNNDRVVRMDDMSGTNFQTLSSSAGNKLGQFRLPTGVTQGPDGGIYVADSANHRLVQMADVTGAGWLEYTGTAPKALVTPTRVKVTAQGIWVLDSGSTSSAARVVFMTDLSGSNFHAWVPSSVGALNNPLGLEIDASGHLFIADTGNNRIVEVDDFNPAGSFSGAVEGQVGTLGSINAGNFNGPADIALSRDGSTLLIADSNNNRLVKLAHPADASGLNATGWGTKTIFGSFTTALNRPMGVAFGSDGRIYVADMSNHRLLRMDDFTGAGLVSLGGDGSGRGQFVNPFGVFVR